MDTDGTDQGGRSADTGGTTGPDDGTDAPDVSGDSGNRGETSAASDGASDASLTEVDAARLLDAVDAPADGAGGGLDGVDDSILSDTSRIDRLEAFEAGGKPEAGAEASGGLDTSRAEAGSGVDSDPTNTVTFSAGLARGPMTGYGWVTVGTADSITSPTCGLDGTTITGANPCSTHPQWTSTTALCVTGSVPALSIAPTPEEYAANWGLQVGVNAKEPLSPIGKSFNTIAINFSGSPSSGLRIELHRSGDLVGTTYCYPLTAATSGTPILLTKFNTACWEGTGTPFTAADAPNIDKVSIQVSPLTGTDITVTNLCLDSIVFGE